MRWVATNSNEFDPVPWHPSEVITFIAATIHS